MQEDWNQTIITRFNELTAQRNLAAAIRICSPVKYQPIFESLIYYDRETQTIGPRYAVEFVEVDLDTILVGHKVLAIANHP